MKHITEDMLIQYAFDLLEAEKQKETRQHLEQCGDCRANLKRIQQQFAALDVLDEDTTLSGELTQKTLSIIARGRKSPDGVVENAGVQSGDSRPRAIMPWVEWTAAAAAVVLVCVLLLQNLPDTHVKDSVSRGTDKPVAKLETPTGFSEQFLDGYSDHPSLSHSERSEESIY